MATIEDLIKSVDALTKGLEDDRKDRKKSESTTPGAQRYAQDDQPVDYYEAKAKAIQDSNAALRREIDTLNALGVRTQEQNKTISENTKKLEENTKSLENLGEAQEAAAGFAGDLAGAFGIVSANSTLTGRAVKALSKDGLPGLNKKLQETFSNANLVASSFSKLSEVAVFAGASVFNDFQGAITSFNKQTGMLDGTMRRNIEDAASGVMRYGVTFQDTSDALASFTNANLMSIKSIRDAAPNLARTTALMSKFGVSADSTASNMEIMVRALGMGAEEAIASQEHIARLGIQIGIGAQAAATSFQQNLPRLSLYGSDAVGIFERTANAATTMGMTVDQVLDIGERFQTFQGAAEAAGSLNAILGGGFIDNIELMEASFEDPAGAALLLRDRIKESGVTLKELGTMGIKAVGEQLGIADPASVRKFLQGNMTGEELMQAQTDPVTKGLEQLADNSQTIAEKTQSIMREQLAALMPLSTIDENLSNFLGGFSGLGLIVTQVGAQIVAAIAMRGLVGGAAGGASNVLPSLLGRAGAGAATAGAAGAVGMGAILGPLAIAAGIGLGGYAFYDAFFKDKRTQPARTQAAQVTTAANQAKRQTQSAMASTQSMAAQTDSMLRETNSTLADVRSLLSDIKTNTASTGKQVSSALKAG